MKRLTAIPLHQRVRELLTEHLSEITLRADNRLPSESALALRLGVSRATIRETLLSMEREGLVTKRQGIGTFIHPSALEAKARIETIVDFSQMIRSAGYAKATLTSRTHNEVASADYAAPLGITAGDGLHVLERIYWADDQPAIFCVIRFPLALVKDPTAWMIPDTIYKTVKRACELEITHRIAWFKARIVDDKAAETLRLHAGQAIFTWDEVMYDLNDRPVLHAEIYFNTAIVPLCTMGKIEPNM